MTTTVPQDIDDTRHALAAETGSPLNDIGSAPDESHLRTGGYHCGAADLRAINAIANDDYSIRQARDRGRYYADLGAGRSHSSAIDYPDDWPNGGRAAWIRFNNLLRHQLGIGDTALVAIRAINYTPDGTTKRRFDTLTMAETSTTDTVTWHTHIEYWRDLEGAVQRRWAKDRLVAIAHSAITGAPLDPPQSVAPPISIGETDMIYQVTNVPPGATDVTGAVVPENGQCAATPNGPFNYTGDEFFSLPASAQAVRIKTTWTRLLALCNALKQPVTLSDAQLTGVETAAHDGAAGAINNATIHAAE